MLIEAFSAPCELYLVCTTSEHGDCTCPGYEKKEVEGEKMLRDIDPTTAIPGGLKQNLWSLHNLSSFLFFSVYSPWLQILGQIIAHLWLKVYIWQPTTETDTSQLKREGNGIYWKAVKLLRE